MKTILTILIFIISYTTANDCTHYNKMATLQENKASKAYRSGDITLTQKHLRFALSNYMAAFKPCMGTNKEDQIIQNTARVNSILIDKNFRDTAALQKYFNKR